jgi:molybdopterin molybdotransferase
MVSYELFARPALRQMAGHRHLFRPEVDAVADEPLRRRPDGKLHLVRVTASREGDVWRVRPAGGQGSHQLSAAAGANALALVADGDGVEAGAPVRVMLVTGLG